MNGMLIFDIIADIGEFFNKVIISLVGGVFKLVNFAYRIFLALAENNIFNQEDFASITTNIYKILSIVMLFILSYGILNKIVDPDSNKSAVDGKKIFTNFIIAIILITLCPSIFQFAYGFQSAFLNSNIISGIFTGKSNDVDSIHYGGIYMSVNTFLPFFTPANGDSSSVYGKTDIGVIRATDPNGSSQEFECSDEDGDEECSLERATNFALETGSFSVFRAFAKNIYEGEVDFDWFAALIVGGFLVYVMISFCFDMGIRVCKLAFYQIIAPIAIFCMVIPKMDDVFKKWLSNVGKTFLSSFTRVFIMNLGVYFISLLADFNLFANSTDTGNGFLNLLAKCFIILGVVAFMRQSPKLLSDLFGFGDGDMKLGIKDKLKAGGAFAAGNAIGSLVTSRGNPAAAFRGFRHGLNNADFHAVGQEYMHRRNYHDALAQGATRGGIMMDRLRRNLGFDSQQKADDYRIDNAEYALVDSQGNPILDATGNQVVLNAETTEQFRREKDANNTAIANLNEEMRNSQNIARENDVVIAARSKIKNDALEEIHKANSDITESLHISTGYTEEQRLKDLEALDDLYTRPGSTMSDGEYEDRKLAIQNRAAMIQLKGNYTALKEQLENNYRNGNLTDEAYQQASFKLAQTEDEMMKKYVTAASHANAADRIYVNSDGDRYTIDGGGKFYTNYQKLADDINHGLLKDADGNTITISGDGWNFVDAAFKQASSVNNGINIQNNNLEREKRTLEQANQVIDGYFDQKAKMQQQAKNTDAYRSHQASSSYNDNNQNNK
ncbi:MAG: hypothetical protein ACI4XR_00040 [Bacilli bacterium]